MTINNKRYKIVNKFRFFISILIITIMLMTLFSVINETIISKGIQQERFNKVIVKSGDTLWDIALLHKPEREDTRYFVYQLKKINDLNTNYIYEGQKLRVPLYD